MNIKKISIVAIIAIIIIAICTGFSMFNQIAVRLGLRNNYFNYFKQGVVTEVAMQSTRDPGFKIVVTEPTAIQDVYKVLSSGRLVPASDKSKLQPDYIVEIYEGNQVSKYDYVAGTTGGSTGNFYNGDQVFHLSKRLDNEIIQNLSFIQKPRDFNTIYYDSILDVLKLDKAQLTQGNAKVAVNLLDDYLCTKFLLSVDIQNFLEQARQIVPGIETMNHDRSKYDIIVNVQNYGFTTKTFKTIITINDKLNNSEKQYYVQGDFTNSWNIEVFNSMPQSWNN
ncbi:hypothetical protein [Clostridium mediterraneense]|uniref:hypothetical protein n=1 Tax=Clostridium mediterraneense TaxID=1805472 RepID=UPI000A06965F|nr:hypothetical protein [Clostridium mediterraneense]